jgi:hypothetical protein
MGAKTVAHYEYGLFGSANLLLWAEEGAWVCINLSLLQNNELSHS